jgi:hypothetical protein
VYDLPIFVWITILFATILMPLTVAVALHRGAVRALGPRGAIGIGVATALLLGGWLVASGLLARSGAYDSAGPLPWSAVAASGTLIALLLAARIPVVASVLAAPGTPARLALPQTFRVLGGIFVVVMAIGHLPALFAVPAGLGDMATGLAAPFIALRLARGNGRGGAVGFNLLGLADLVVAVSMASIARYVGVAPSTEQLRLLPLVLVPTTAVPLAVVLHVVSLGQLLPGRTRVTAVNNA